MTSLNGYSTVICNFVLTSVLRFPQLGTFVRYKQPRLASFVYPSPLQGGSKSVEKTNQLTKKEIEDLLKKGAYGAIMDDDNAGDKFCEEDIEHILQRRTTTVTVEQDKAGSSFSKASFASNDTVSDISIDDPDFWAKWAKKAEVEEIDESTR